MRKPSTPQQLAVDILERSICAVQVGAVIADRHGIFAWGWNHEGAGHGMHAEQHAISRANPGRLRTSTIYVAGKRKRNGKIVNAEPCINCTGRIYTAGIYRVSWRNENGKWIIL